MELCVNEWSCVFLAARFLALQASHIVWIILNVRTESYERFSANSWRPLLQEMFPPKNLHEALIHKTS